MKSKNNTSGLKKTVAIIGTRGYPSYYGGFETAVRKVAPVLVESGWQVNVYGRKGATLETDPERDARIRTTFTRGLNTKSMSTLTFGLTSVLHACWEKPDVALIMNVANGFWLPLLKLRRVPTVINVDGIEWERAKWGRFAKMVFKMGALLTAKFGDLLVSDSKEIQRRWKSEFARDSVFIPYGGDTPGDLGVTAGLESGGYILLVARFVPENTVMEFFDAAERLAPDYPIVIVGSSGFGGELDDAASSLSERHPTVTWLGHVSKDSTLLSLWKHAGVYFHGHSVGGTNPALVQAMACGAPIVARRTAYNLEVLGSDRFLVDPTPDAIEGGIRKLMEDKAVRVASSKSSRERAQQLYTWDGVSRSYEQAISRTARVDKKPA